MIEQTTITTASNHSIEPGDILGITVENSLWKMIWYWIIRKPLKRYEYFTIDHVTESTLTIEGQDKGMESDA